MRILLTLIALIHTINAFCSPFGIREDDEVLRGKLDNGLEYYIRENPYPEGKVSLRLVVKVGSNHEQEHEKGIAHFIEHLVFRGSQHFRDGEVETYLESLGAWSGADTNAYTSFDHTVFWLDIPLEKRNSLQTALTILSDFASTALLADEVIEKEREVVLDELYQAFSSPYHRFERTLVSTLLPDSLYARNSPGGSLEVVQTVSPETLRSFYKRWYRPDRMAIVAVGDVDQQEMVRMIKRSFGSLVCPKEGVKVETPPLYYLDGSLATVLYDPEYEGTQVDLFSIQHLQDHQGLFEDPYKEGFYAYACTRLFEERLKKVEEAEIVFLNTYVEEAHWHGNTELFYVEADLFEERFQEGLHTLHYEMQKVIQHGFLNSEWERLSRQLEADFEGELDGGAISDHSTHASRCVDHFLQQRMLSHYPSVLEKFLELTQETTVDELNQYLPYFHLGNPLKIFLLTSSTGVRDQITDDQLFALFHQNCETLPSEDEELEVLFEVIPQFPRGWISDRQEFPDIETSVLTLSNGIKLILKKNEAAWGELHLSALAQGGILSLPQEQCHSAQLAVEYGIYSGLQGLSYRELSRALEERGVYWNAEISENTRSFHLNADSCSLEESFQLIHAFFGSPHFDPIKWDHLTARVQEYLKQMAKDPEFQFMNYVLKTNTQQHYYFQPLDLSCAHEADARFICEQSFARPQEFIFAIVGDYDEAEVEELAEIYLASLPSTGQSPFSRHRVKELFPEEVMIQEFKAGHKPYATNVVTIPFSYREYLREFGNSSAMQAVTKILNQRLWEQLRNQLGKTYGVSVDYGSLFYPDASNSFVQIHFTCQPQHRQVMFNALFAEIERLKTTPPSLREVETIKALLLSKHRQGVQHNDYWAALLLAAQSRNLPFHQMLGFEEWVRALNPDMLLEAARWLFSSPYHSVISHLPED